MERKSGKCTAQAHSCSRYEGVDFRSRRRHRCLRFCVLQIIGQRSQLDSMRSQFLWDMLDMANAPLQVARAKEEMENIIEELHGTLTHGIAERKHTGQPGLIGPMRKGF